MKRYELSMNSSPHGLFGKMFPDYSHQTADAISPESCFQWSSMGIADATGCSTASGSEWPSAEEGSSVCSLAEILEPNAPQKYSLSPKACAGILRRSERRGKILPEALLSALKSVARSTRHPATQGGEARPTRPAS